MKNKLTLFAAVFTVYPIVLALTLTENQIGRLYGLIHAQEALSAGITGLVWSVYVSIGLGIFLGIKAMRQHSGINWAALISTSLCTLLAIGYLYVSF